MTRKWASIEYLDNNKLNYTGQSGRWLLLDKKYIEHELDSRNAEVKFNFGGIYAITTLNDSSMTMVKLLTSSRDMTRTINFVSDEKWKSRVYSKTPRIFQMDVDEHLLDSIGSLSNEWLFNEGFDLRNDTILFRTADSLYLIKRKRKQD
ncbi:MAG: hypothetical protein MI865_03660 [Proteobacteria bacterium]|nr:hypothetical protein [Pseudomonadota bacterium]